MRAVLILLMLWGFASFAMGLSGCSARNPVSSALRSEELVDGGKLVYIYPQIVQFQAPLCVIFCIPQNSEVFTDAKAAQGFAGQNTVGQTASAGGSP